MSKFKVGDRVCHRLSGHLGTVSHIEGDYTHSCNITIKRDDGRRGAGSDGQWLTDGEIWELASTTPNPILDIPDQVAGPSDRKIMEALLVVSAATIFVADDGTLSEEGRGPAFEGMTRAIWLTLDKYIPESPELDAKIVNRINRIRADVRDGRLPA